MLKHLKLIGIFWSTAIAAEMEYRVNFVLAALSSIGNLAGSLFGLFLFYGKGYTFPGWSWSWEIQTNKLVWSPEVYDLYGLILGNSSLQYENWYNALHPEDRARANADVLRVIEQRLPELYTEFRIVHPQRGTRWLVGLGRLTFNEQGEPIRLSGINLDITERKQAEEVLRQSEEFKHRMLESSSDCIKVLDLDGRLLYMNTGGMCLLEIDDITCHINTDWTSFWQGDDRTAAEAALATARAGNVSRFQGFCPTAKGTPKWWDIAITPILDNVGHGHYGHWGGYHKRW